MRILACVVAFNRAPLLAQVLHSLTSQSYAVDVLVVDNASVDNTRAVVSQFDGRVHYFNTGKNLGGAGGFAWAVELACAMPYDYAYLLDDDAIPSLNAIQVLVETLAANVELQQLPFLASTPVSVSKDSHPVGTPVPSTVFERQKRLIGMNAIAIDYAAFLGVLVSLEAARAAHLPIADFFIWGDDVEYTTRLGRVSGGACIPASTLVHESPEMQSASNRRPLGWKYHFKVRNGLWLLRWGLPDADRVEKAGQLLILLRVTATELQYSHFLPTTVIRVIRAWGAGLFARRPKYSQSGELIRTSVGATNWLKAAKAGGN